VTRILVDNEWYEPLSSKSILESEYEQSIYRYSPMLFPGYRCLQFNEIVESEFGSSKADMVLVDLEYRGWTIVEAELEHHPLARHVEPQMRRLVNGEYNERHAVAISRLSDAIDPVRMLNLVRSSDPDFLVIVPNESIEWRTTLSNLGVKLATVEVFVSHRGRRIVNYSGDTPQSWDDGHLSKLSRDGILPRAFKVDIPSAIPQKPELSLTYQGLLTTWRVMATKKVTYILPNGSFDLDEGQPYVICRNQQGDLEIKVEDNG
jgi:hypothetical protein